MIQTSRCSKDLQALLAAMCSFSARFEDVASTIDQASGPTISHEYFHDMVRIIVDVGLEHK